MNTLSAQWYAALPLEDRIAKLHPPLLTSHRDSTPSHNASAQNFVASWRQQAPFTNDAIFEQRLAQLGISEAELLNVLGHPLAMLQAQIDTPPGWLQRLDALYEGFDSAEWLSQQTDNSPDFGFLALVAPFIADATCRVDNAINDLALIYPTIIDSQRVSTLFTASLHDGLLEIIKRALTVELRFAKRLNMLSGATPESRFASFIDLITQKRYALGILASYPVMAAQIATCTDLWLAANLEFIERLCLDYYDLTTTFATNGQPLGQLVAVEDKLSDLHRGGRTVKIVTFSSGSKVVYKPKSLHIDARFQDLLDWFNNAQDTLTLRLTKLVTREAHGWVEYFDTASCNSEDGIQAFYTRMGAYLAIFYTLKASDLHAENIIAAGEHPVFIDLETLFHNHLTDFEFDGAARQVGERLRSSVLSTLLLPQKLWSNDNGVGVDLSGLGAVRTQAAPVRGLAWRKVGTDDMHVVYDFVGHSQNIKSRPLLNGDDVALSDYASHIEAGFTHFYRLIKAQRDSYLNLVANLFSDTPIRCLLRPTQLYYMLRRECYNPKYQRDALQQLRLLDKLWLQAVDNPKMARLISAEQRDIRQGDFPLFTSYPGSRDLWDSRGEQLPDFFGESGLHLAQKVIGRMSERDLGEQLWLLRTSMASLTKPTRKPLAIRQTNTQNIKERLLETACNIVDQQLQPLAASQSDELTWLVFSANASKGWSVTFADMNLYDGVNGIALFLAYLGHVTGETRYTRLAEQSINSLRRLREELTDYSVIGGFEGWGSVIYGLTHLGVLWERPDLLEEAAAIAYTLPAIIANDTYLDILAGSAGCIAAVLNLYAVHPAPELLEVATVCGERLLATAVNMRVGIGWKNHIATEAPFSGFSHGAAGVAWSLLRLADETGDARFHEAALQAIAYERTLFIPAASNWQDLRPPEPGETQRVNGAMAWCHGAPGIGLGRLLSVPYLDDPMCRTEIDIAVATTLKHGLGNYHPGFGHNYSLCHGDLGNLDIILETSLRSSAHAHLEEDIYDWAAVIMDNMAEYGWLCGVPHGIVTPGLMTGIAGIGYALLRLAAPTMVPSVLALAGPQPSPILQTPVAHLAALAV